MEFLRMTSSQYRQFRSQPKSKYGAQKTVVNGIKYDSKHEALRSTELEYLQNIGVISDLKRQEKFLLQEGFVDRDGNKIRPIYYVSDFTYIRDGQKIIEDAKSIATRKIPVYQLKKKIMLYKYPEYKFIES